MTIDVRVKYDCEPYDGTPGTAYDDFEEGKKKDTHSRAQNKYLYIYIYIMSKIRSRVIAVLCC